jgi:phosphohistidine swiveling domain-containing protein
MGSPLVDLRELPADAEPRFGGKAAGLARLLRAGAAVPPGFAVEAAAGGPEAWPGELGAGFAARLTALLQVGPVAVRSSAVGEDSRERSFAGLLETRLRVRSAEDALEAVRACRASAASPRVLAYAGGERLRVGVVVQQQIEARRAGVCFTKDPTGRDGAVVVEAVSGMGDALVGGRAAPERWRVYRNGWGDWECQREPGEAAVLQPREATRIAEQARALEAGLGPGLDLEWAQDADGRLWWLQARPITAGAEPPAWIVQRACEDVDDGRVSVWSSWNVRETLPLPLFPLTWAVWRDVILPAVVAHFFGPVPGSRLARQLTGIDLVHGRVYFNLNALLATPGLRRLTLEIVRTMDARTGGVIADLVGRGILRPRRLSGNPLSRALRLSAAGLRGLLRFSTALRPRRALAVLEEDAAAIAARPKAATLDDRALVGELSLWSAPETQRLLFGLQMEGGAAAVYVIARRAYRGHPRAAERLATGIPADPTTRISLAIDDLVLAARGMARVFAAHEAADELLRALDTSETGRGWKRQLDAFLAEFGHRGPGEFDLATRRWREDPTMILDLVRAALCAGGSEPLAMRMRRLAESRRAAIGQAVAGSAAWRRPLLRACARLVELYMPLREAPKHYGLVVFARMREAALELGRRLAARGVVPAAEDVFLLELDELRAVVAGPAPPRLRDEIEVRRARMSRFLRERPPDLLRSDGVPVLEPELALRPGVLRGTPISGGRVSGPARILVHPDPRRLDPGDVLVVEFADPGWTPLFARAAAVVMEVGGVMCHAAVVAREMGIPAVFGVAGATRRLVDGERVGIDGAAGTVTRMV